MSDAAETIRRAEVWLEIVAMHPGAGVARDSLVATIRDLIALYESEQAAYAELAAAVSADPAALGHIGVVSLAKAHRQDSENVDEYEADRESEQAATQGLREYAQHKPTCRRSSFSCDPKQWEMVQSLELLSVPCTCGLAALTKESSRPVPKEQE